MSSKTENRLASLKRRVRQFYELLNKRDFEACHQMIDPRVRQTASSVTLYQYENALSDFIAQFGSIKLLEISLSLHLAEPSKLYEGRDFALGKTSWEDEAGEQHLFSERWVWENRTWYTRSTGFITPATPSNIARQALVRTSRHSERKTRSR